MEASMSSSIATDPSSFPNYLSTVIVANFVSFKLENSNNYFSWKQQILCLIESQGLLPFIDGTIAPLQLQDDVAWRTDRVVKGWILGALAGPVLNNVAKLCNARDVWLALEQEFTQSEAISNPPPSEAISNPPPSTSQAQDEAHNHLPLYRAILIGDWGKAKQIIRGNPRAITARLSVDMQTPLHIAVGTGKANHFVKQLVDLMTDEQLGVTDIDGYTALHMAAFTGNTEAAKVLLGRRPDLVNVANNDGKFPVHLAAISAQDKTLWYLIFQRNDDLSPYQGDVGVYFLCSVIEAEFFDIALYLAETFSDLATINTKYGTTALLHLTRRLSAFSSRETQLNFWERFLLYAAFWVINVSVPRAKAAHLKKHKYLHAIKLLKCLCKNMESLDLHRATDIYVDVMLTAARLGVPEVIEELVATFPQALDFCGPNDQTIFHVAVENRSEKVYNLTYQMSSLKHYFSDSTDKSENTLLHLAGKLAPPHRLNLVSGAALQMQRELQWFNEVQKFVNPCSREHLNNDGMAPKMIFTEEHAQLKIEGEKWMKDTANSCTIVAALITTVVFAAAFTVPGGTEGNTGFPIFSTKVPFIIFAVSDAISLFTSTTSLLMFLSILTSRYAEQDFLYALPKRLCIGLATLFVSISFMTVAFAATIWIVFGRTKATWILIPVGLLSCLPVTSFVLLQFPLLVDVISSTYGPGIFGRQSNRPFF